jgi:type IV secretion system protein VirD4
MTHRSDAFVFWLLGGLFSVMVSAWGVVQLACLLAGRKAIRLPVEVLPNALAAWPHNFGDPRGAFPATIGDLLPGPVEMNGALAVVLLLDAGLILGVRRLLPRALETGLANRREVRDQLSAETVRRRAALTRPSINARKADAHQLGLGLGRDVRTGIELFGSVEDSYLYLGPPRSGKGVNLVIPQCRHAPGPVIVTSTRPDTLAATLEARAGRGPMHIFDPQGISNHRDALRWSPVHGCADPLTAIMRARALTSGSKLTTVRDGEYWDAMTQAVVRCYLHAAALEGLPVTEVLAWISRPADSAPVRILRGHPDAAPGWADELAAQSTTDTRQRDSVWSGVRRAFDSLADPRVLFTCTPSAVDAFDARRFLASNGTLYLVGSSGSQMSVAPLISALIEDIVETARRMAARSPGGRLDPPLCLLLDEAANIAPIPSLPSLLSDGGGSGITTVAVLQSLAQARARWGDAQAETMWDAATVKVVLGGLAHAEDLHRISRLAGDIDNETRTVTRGPNGTTVATSLRRLPALPIERIRGLPLGRAIVLGRRARPVESALTPYAS